MGIKQSTVPVCRTGRHSQQSTVKEKPSRLNLAVEIAGIKLKNPVMVASGTFGYGEEYAPYVDLNRLGAIVAKGLSLKPRPGNPPPRICETPSGMLNAIGLENVGVEAFIKEKLPFIRKYDTRVIVNIFGSTIEEYVEVAKSLNGVKGVDGIEVNISCPNVKEGGILFGTDIKSTFHLLSSVRKVTELPLIAKLSPNVTDIVQFAKVARDAGVDALSLINTIIGMAIDTETWRPKLANIAGGLSGPAIRPVAVRMVWEVHQKVDLPIIGMGGIMTAADAIEFFLAGARAIAIGTANFVNPAATIEIIEGIETYLVKKGIGDIGEIIGAVKL